MSGKDNPSIGFLPADWPAPTAIRAGTTLRAGGVSAPPFDSLNLGDRVGDDPAAVAANRARLVAALGLPAAPVWLDQVHGARVADADRPVAGVADASLGARADTVCAVLTADCLPVVLTNRAGTCWAAAHAGWRGLAAGVLEATVSALPAPASDVIAWMGPSIGRRRFEVGADVRAALCDRYGYDAIGFDAGAKLGKYLLDVYTLARARLARAGVAGVYGGGLCTVGDRHRFYSFRRARVTGRMATLVWSAQGP